MQYGAYQDEVVRQPEGILRHKKFRQYEIIDKRRYIKLEGGWVGTL